ncbi:MAG: hypothetical protein SPL55_02310 [Prevotella sp.]|nr:hypothetical protein [Prevotella sp.]
MFNFNNNKKDNDIPQLDLDELFQRLEHLERKCRRMDGRIAELEEQLAQIDVKKTNFDAQNAENSTSEALSVAENEVESVGIHIEETPSSLHESPSTLLTPHSSLHTPHSTEILYLAAPSPDGTFSQASAMEQIGKSIYQLTTTDGQNGTFILLDTPDAIATAMISVSQFVKPACKISGNTAIQPRHIITEEEGTASREGTGWKITRKAVVRFE